MLVIPAIRKLRQEDCHKSEVNLGYRDLVSEREKGKGKKKSLQPRIHH